MDGKGRRMMSVSAEILAGVKERLNLLMLMHLPVRLILSLLEVNHVDH